ncbi:MAG: type transport system permease protein [Thermoleophilaceae bacterium]|nr:type transport system permease protein [Thermoleophilaceae bacterium]
MTRLVHAELLKLRTTRTFWAMAGAATALVLLIVVLSLALDDHLRSEDDVLSLLSTIGVAGLLAMVLGVVAAAGEYRHGTIASTLLVTPQRLRAVTAAVLACALGGLAIGVAISAVTALIALPWLSAKDVDMPSTGAIVEVFVGGALFAALAAALGAALGALLRNQVAAVVSLLAFIFILDPTISALLEDVAPYTLSGLSAAMNGGESGTDLLPRGIAALVWALYAALLGAGAAVLTARRDI